MSNALAIIKDDIYGIRDRFNALAGNDKTFEKEAGFAIQVLQQSEYALKLAMENRQSVINAVTNVAAIGISLNPAKKQAYLVPRDGRICLDISYMGLLDLAIQSGSVLWGQAELVHEGDAEFTLNDMDKLPTHKRNPFAKNRGAVTGVYVVVKTRDGDYLTTCMSIDEVYAIRDRSSAWKAFLSKKAKCPWVTDEGEMTKKTVIKRAYKLWPKTERSEAMERAIEYLNNEGGEGLADMAQASSGPGVIKGTDGAMASLSIEVQNYMRELAGEVEEMFRDPERGTPFAFDRIEIESMDNDCKVALWSVLPSDLRTALKQEGDMRRKAAAKPVPRAEKVE